MNSTLPNANVSVYVWVLGGGYGDPRRVEKNWVGSRIATWLFLNCSLSNVRVIRRQATDYPPLNISINALLCETPGSDRNINQQPFNDRNRLGLGTKFEGDTSDQVLKPSLAISLLITSTPRDDLSPSLKSIWPSEASMDVVPEAQGEQSGYLAYQPDGSGIPHDRLWSLPHCSGSTPVWAGLPMKSIRISNPTRRGGDSQQCASRREPHLKGSIK